MAVTGVAGFIGSNILEELLKFNQKVLGIDNLSTGQIKNLQSVKKNVGLKKWKKNFKFLKVIYQILKFVIKLLKMLIL